MIGLNNILKEQQNLKDKRRYLIKLKAKILGEFLIN